MESKILKNIVSLNIDVAVIDPNRFYESETEDSDYSDNSDSEGETKTCADEMCQQETDVSKSPAVRRTSVPQSSKKQTTIDASKSDERTSGTNEAPTTHTPEAVLSSSSQAAPSYSSQATTSSTSEAATSSTSEATSSTSAADLPTSATNTGEELDPQPIDEPVEMIDGLFDFVPFNIDEDVVLKEVEKNDKQFDLASYITDQSETPTSCVQGSSISPSSSSPVTIASPILTSPEMQSNNPKNEATVSNIPHGIGQGKDFTTLMKCYNQKVTLQKSKMMVQGRKVKSEKEVESLAKSNKENGLKPKGKKVNSINGKNAKLAKKKDLKPMKDDDLKPIKGAGIKTLEGEQSKLVKEKNLKPVKREYVKLVKEEKFKSDIGNKPKLAEETEMKPCKESKVPKGEKARRTTENHYSPKNTYSTAQNSPNSAEEVNRKIDEFTKAIVASMAVVHIKPNFEKRRNSDTKKRMRNFQTHSLKFHQYLSDRKVTQSSMSQKSSNGIPTLKGDILPKAAKVSNVHLKIPPQRKQNTKMEYCASIGCRKNVELKTSQQQHQNIIEKCVPIGNVNTPDLKTSPQQQVIKIVNCEPTYRSEAPAAPSGMRKISIQDYINRKRSQQSSNSGSDIDSDSNIVTKKRITMDEYNKRRAMS